MGSKTGIVEVTMILAIFLGTSMITAGLNPFNMAVKDLLALSLLIGGASSTVTGLLIIVFKMNEMSEEGPTS